MENDEPITPLLVVLRALKTDKRRDVFALHAGTTANYLYQLACCERTSCRADLALRIAQASMYMRRRYAKMKLPTVTVEQLASMCPLPKKAA